MTVILTAASLHESQSFLTNKHLMTDNAEPFLTEIRNQTVPREEGTLSNVCKLSGISLNFDRLYLK